MVCVCVYLIDRTNISHISLCVMCARCNAVYKFPNTHHRNANAYKTVINSEIIMTTMKTCLPVATRRICSRLWCILCVYRLDMQWYDQRYSTDNIVNEHHHACNISHTKINKIPYITYRYVSFFRSFIRHFFCLSKQLMLEPKQKDSQVIVHKSNKSNK